MSVRVEFGLLGLVMVRFRGDIVPIARGKQRALLAALLLKAGHLVSTEQLIDALWGDTPPASARAALHNQVKRLRDALGEVGRDRICTQPGGYLIRVEPAELDRRSWISPPKTWPPGPGGRSLARAAGAEFRVVVCACSDRELHRARLERRARGIPGWHEGGNWANVERRLAEFPPWTGEVLTIDAVQPLAQNLATVLEYVTD